MANLQVHSMRKEPFLAFVVGGAAIAAGTMIGVAAGFIVSPWFGICTGSVSYAAMTSGALAQRNRVFSVSEIRLSGEQST